MKLFASSHCHCKALHATWRSIRDVAYDSEIATSAVHTRNDDRFLMMVVINVFLARLICLFL